MKKYLSSAVCVSLTTLTFSTFAQSSPVSDWLKVWDGHGNLVAEVQATEADEIANGSSHIYSISSSLVPVDSSQFGNYTSVQEPGSTGLSDIFGVAHSGTDYYLAFQSDTDSSALGVPANKITVQETSSPVDATMYLSPSLRDAGYTAQFFSDVESVPDAGTTAGLLSLGLMGLGLLRKCL